MSKCCKTPEEAAAALGLVVVRPNENELFVDLDSNSSEAFGSLLDRITILSDIYPNLVSVEYTTSKSGNRHVYVTVSNAKFNSVGRITLQACLGSDSLHELLSLQNYMEGGATPTVFFEKPDAKRRKTFDE